LLKAVFDVAIVGDDDPVPTLQRDMVRRIKEAPDPRRKLAIYGEHLARAGPRAAAVQLLVRDAAAADVEAASVWDQMLAERLEGMTHFARDLAQEDHLRDGISFEEARDVLWTSTPFTGGRRTALVRCPSAPSRAGFPGATSGLSPGRRSPSGGSPS
jgi:hypothetical protein